MLQVHELKKAYGDRLAVNGLSLQVNRGEIVGLLGPNGAGKSTTVSMIAGLASPSEGRVTLDGLPVQESGVRRRIGLAPQELSLYDKLSAHENLSFLAALHGMRGDAAREAIDRVLRRVQLQDRSRDIVKGFSGGMKRRLNIAAALLHDPDLVLLDEPTAGVDPQSRAQLFECIEDLRDQGKAVIYTTHYMEEAERLCDRIAIMDQGQLLDMAPLRQLLHRHGGDSELSWSSPTQVRKLRTHEPQAMLRQWLAEPGAAEAHIGVRPPSLEDVFLNLTGRALRD